MNRRGVGTTPPGQRQPRAHGNGSRNTKDSSLGHAHGELYAFLRGDAAEVPHSASRVVPITTNYVAPLRDRERLPTSGGATRQLGRFAVVISGCRFPTCLQVHPARNCGTVAAGSDFAEQRRGADVFVSAG